jgi:hypothetical protein
MSKLERQSCADDEGYVAAEALMASIILAGALAFGLVAFVKARQITEASLELRRATALTQSIMAVRLETVGQSAGQTPALAWRVDLAQIGQTGRIVICRRAVRIQGRAARVRTYDAATLQTCPQQAES